jgi:hypothetical protein
MALRGWLAVAVVIGGYGCAAPRAAQFRQFAQAGLAYAGAVDALTREAAGAAIDADSAVLERARDGLATKEERQQTVLDHNALLEERVAILSDLARHAQILSAYFAGLDALAAGGEPGAAAAGAAAQELVRSMGLLSERIREARIGAEPVARFSGAVTRIVVGRLQSSALEHELRVRGPALERELDTQHAAMQAIAEALRADLEIALDQLELVEIVEPYRGEGRLARVWTRRRREILAASAASSAADVGVAAAASLKESFTALARGDLSHMSVAGLLAEVGLVLDLLERVKGLQAPP